MDRYINADKVERSLVFLGDTQYEQDIKKAVLQLLQVQPAADVKKVVRGEWKYSRTVSELACVVCSNCGHEAFAVANYVTNGIGCPFCLADMRGEVE